MNKNPHIRKHMIGSWRQGELAGEGSGIRTLTIRDDGSFSYVVTRDGIFSRTVSLINGSNHLTGSWVLQGEVLSLFVKKYNEGVTTLLPTALIGTVVANITGLDYGGEISAIDQDTMVLNQTTWERV